MKKWKKPTIEHQKLEIDELQKKQETQFCNTNKYRICRIQKLFYTVLCFCPRYCHSLILVGICGYIIVKKWTNFRVNRG